MLSFPAAIKVYLCTVPCDMRRSFDGLSMLAEHLVQCNPLSGHLFVYGNRRTDRLKILYWDRDGWAIWDQTLGGGDVPIPLQRRWPPGDRRLGARRAPRGDRPPGRQAPQALQPAGGAPGRPVTRETYPQKNLRPLAFLCCLQTDSFVILSA